jgi:hypothetical protein
MACEYGPMAAGAAALLITSFFTFPSRCSPGTGAATRAAADRHEIWF